MLEDILSKYEERRALLEQLSGALAWETQDALSDLYHIDRISFRVKTAESFAKKALDPQNVPPYKDPFVEIEDQVGGRIIVFFVSDIELVLNCLRGTYTTVERTHRRPVRDAEFGYESHHLICLIPPHLIPDGWSLRQDLPTTFELQVRTIFMHAYAEPQHDLAYKAAHELPGDIRRELAWFAASAWGADRTYERVWQWHLATNPIDHSSE